MNKITRMHILGHKVLEYDVDERGIIIDERERNRTHSDHRGGSYLVKEDSGDGIPSAIKKSMVLWYDIKKQGATNESLAANPVLTDLSGNGHDLTLHNFAWSDMSGIGGYITNFNLSPWLTVKDRGEHSVNNNKIIIHNTTIALFPLIYSNNMPNKFTIKVTGVDENHVLYIDGFKTRISKNGIYDIIRREESGYMGFGTFDIYDSCNIIIELLPEYPNALVTDGVDDYGFVEGLPLLEDFTIIAKRKYLNIASDCILANKLDIGNNDTRGIVQMPGAFGFEIIEPGYGTYSTKPIEDLVLNYSFGLPTVNLYQDIGDVSYMTATSYNGIPINKGESTDTDFLYIASTNSEYGLANVAIYSVLLFNRSLSQEEIDWVKINLLNEEQ